MTTTEKFILEVPLDLANRARAFAESVHQPLETLLVGWVDRALADAAVETLPDEDVLRLCDGEMAPSEQEELSGLLAENREGGPSAAEHRRLDELMRTYREGLLRKGRAWRVAAARGLRSLS